jgi:hypothetical protein
VISIGFYGECGHLGGESIAEAVGGCPIAYRDMVANYLDTGNTFIVAAGWVDDVLDRKNLRVGGLAVLTDGQWLWPAVLGYYVRTYGVSVPAEFLAHVVSGATVPELSIDDLIEIEKSLANERRLQRKNPSIATEHEEAVSALVNRELSPADFLSLFGSSDGQELSRSLLADAVQRKDGRGVGLALVTNTVFGFSIELMPALLELMAVSWHSSHESVVRALGALGSEEAVYALFFATQWVPEDRKFDTSRTLATTAVWALGAIPGERATNLLKVLAQWEVHEIVRKGAVNQLDLRERAGKRRVRKTK